MIVDKIKKRKVPERNKTSRVDIPIGKWVKCENCKEILYKETVRSNLNICPNCGHYFRMHTGKRIDLIIDEGTYKKFDLDIETTNPLELEDYPKKLKALREKTGLKEAVACGYWNMWRFNPALKAEGKNPFILDSTKEPKYEDFRAFMMNETRYASLKKGFPEIAESLFVKTEADAKERLEGYIKLAE